jgi:DNA-binding transcriptional LysR family regulator
MFPSTFRRLEVFVAVVEAGSFVAGAVRLGISHPSISNHIKSLEQHIGCELFARRRGSVSSLTEPGRRLYERATRLLEEAQLLSLDLAPNRPQPQRPRLTITTQRVLAEYVIRQAICELVRGHPDMDLVLESGNFEDSIEHLVKNAADVCCVMTFGPIPEMPSEIIGRQRFAFYVAPDHPLAQRTGIGVAELANQPFVATRRDGHYGQMVHKLIASTGISTYHVAYKIQDGSIINELTAQGRVVCCGLVPAAERFVLNGSLVELSVDAPPLFADVHLILPSKRRPGKLAMAFVELMRQHSTTSNSPGSQ